MTTLVAEINLQPGRDQGYSACVPVRLGKLRINAFVDSGNTFANVISPQTMSALGIQVSQLEPVPQLSVGTAAAGRQMKVLGQAPRIVLQFGQLPTKFRIRPLVLQGLVHPLNLCGPFLWRVGIDQLHSQGVLRIHGRDVPMCTPRGIKSLPPSPEVCTLHVATSSPKPQQYQPHGPAIEARPGSTVQRIEGKSRRILPVKLEPPLPAGALVLLQPTARSLLGDNPILQEVRSDGSLAVLIDNLEYEDIDLEPGALVGSVQEVTATPATDQAGESPPLAAAAHEEFDALPQADKIKWLATQFRLEDAPALQRDPPSTEGGSPRVVAVLRRHLYWRVRQDQPHHSPHQPLSRDRAHQDETPTLEPCHGGILAATDRSVVGTASRGRSRLTVVFSARPCPKKEQQGDPVGCQLPEA